MHIYYTGGSFWPWKEPPVGCAWPLSAVPYTTVNTQQRRFLRVNVCVVVASDKQGNVVVCIYVFLFLFALSGRVCLPIRDKGISIFTIAIFWIYFKKRYIFTE